MAIYSNTKSINKAIPTVYVANNVVKKWDIEFTITSTVEGANTFSSDYQFTAELEAGLPLSSYDESSVIALIPTGFDDVFDAHYEALSGNIPPAESETSTISDFVFSEGGEGPTNGNNGIGNGAGGN